MANVTVSFSLDSTQDADILRWLEGLPRRGRSEAIRIALRSGISGSITLGDVYQAIREIDRKLARGVIAITEGGDVGDLPDEPPDIAAALDNLGL